MFWVLKGRSECSYVFVYDDTDKVLSMLILMIW